MRNNYTTFQEENRFKSEIFNKQNNTGVLKAVFYNCFPTLDVAISITKVFKNSWRRSATNIFLRIKIQFTNCLYQFRDLHDLDDIYTQGVQMYILPNKFY